MINRITAALLVGGLGACGMAAAQDLRATTPLPIATVLEVPLNEEAARLSLTLAAGERAIIQWDDGSPLSLSLKLPDGELLSRSSAPAGVSFLSASALPASAGEQRLMRALFSIAPNSLVIAASVAGTYTLLPQTLVREVRRFRIYRSSSPYRAILYMAKSAPLHPVEPRPLAVALSRGDSRLSGATVKARMLDQNHRLVFPERMLTDDGYGADRVAADGIYSTELYPASAGRYVLQLTVELTGPQGFYGTLQYDLNMTEELAGAGGEG